MTLVATTQYSVVSFINACDANGRYLASAASKCEFCDPKCIICFGTMTAAECDACVDGYVLDVTTCGNTCTAGYYADSAARRCN